ncbi:hypothetical protein [Reyranella soli]|jgi:hypothetical protein|uniref:Uncharacterized protein n=1 Tax=Reyranella soli TaxID=1230389 RepID=A0A512NLD5_9HYPH|nr:hypothetical protein [Reyranella soli]GEP59755.1 hypothetical protein RSO01_69210 [Reyranella soli]
MKKLTSLSAAAVTALVVGLGFATTSNAQTPMSSPMSDQEYCHLLAATYSGGYYDGVFKYGRSDVGNATAVAIAQCLEGDAQPAIPVLEQRLRDANIPVPTRG